MSQENPPPAAGWGSGRGVAVHRPESPSPGPSRAGRGGEATPRLAVRNLHSALAGPYDLNLAPGECVAISGASGSGKSVLMRMIADLDPNDGEILLDGHPRSSFPAPAWRRAVAYVPAESGWWHDRVADHFPDLPTAKTLFQRLALKPELLDGPGLRLSTGERQRAALVRALIPNSRVLLLDEPTGALDETAAAHVEAVLLERLKSGVAIILVTHLPAQAARLATRHFEMRDFRLHPA